LRKRDTGERTFLDALTGGDNQLTRLFWRTTSMFTKIDVLRQLRNFMLENINIQCVF
jgi:hypothetical protein